MSLNTSATAKQAGKSPAKEAPTSVQAAPPLPPIATSSIIPNDHFFKPKPADTMPWEMTIEERRRASKDPRIQKQVHDSDQWNNTVVEHIWKKISEFALPRNDWIMPPEGLAAMLSSLGIEGAHFQEKVLKTFDPKESGTYNGLVMCKIFLISLTTEPYQDAFVRHCFNQFDKVNPDDEFIDKDLLYKHNLQNPAELTEGKKGKKGKKGKGNSLPLQTVAGATYDMVEGLKHAWEMGYVETVRDTVITYAEFKAGFTDPINAKWVASFFNCIIEVAASMYSPPNGHLPLVPLRWLVTTEPVESTQDMADADVILLREIEELGADPLAPQKSKKGKKKK